MSLRDLQNQNHSEGNLLAFAAPLLHDKAFELCQKIISAHNKGKGLNILILGAGSGYFDQLLLDAGVRNIDAIEYIPEYYNVKGTRLYTYDLNVSWANKLLSQNNNRKYDLVIAIEVIEHLENSFMLMREIKSVLGHKGQIVITSPNVESTFSKVKFLLTGHMEYFGLAELEGTGHIQPIFSHIFKLNLNLANINYVATYYNRNIWNARVAEASTAGKRRLIKLVSYIVFCFVLLFKGYSIYNSELEGEINIYHLENSNQ